MAKEYSLKQYALSYAKLGFAVFPVQAKGKAPATKNGFKDASKDPRLIQSWWDKNPNYNIGIATGSVSNGLFVIDIDVDNEKGIYGDDSLRDWEIANGKLPDTCRAITGRGGNHLYYKSKEKVSCRAGLLPGIDIRGEGGYIIAPPSIHPNGRCYEWEQDPKEYIIAEANDTVLKLLAGENKAEKEYFKMSANVEAGSRNATLFKLASSLQAKGLSNTTIMKAVLEENDLKCNPPLEDGEVEQIVNSVLKYDKGDFSVAPELNILDFHKLSKNGVPYDVFDDRIANHIIKSVPLFVIAQKPYIYQDGVYVLDESGNRLKSFIKKFVISDVIRQPLIDRIYKLIVADISLEKDFDDVNKYPHSCINFKNGIFDCKSWKMIPHSKDYLSINQIPHEFHPEVSMKEDSVLDEFIEGTIPDQGDRNMLYEYIGYCMARDTSQQKFMIITGPGGTGKSTIVRMIEKLIGKDNICSVALQDLNKRFYPTQLRGKLLNSCADISKIALEQTDVIKKITGEDSLMGEYKGGAIFAFKSYAKLLFSANEIPISLDDKSNAFYRRFLIIRIEKRGAFIDNLETKLEKEVQLLLHKSVLALRDMYKRGNILESANSKTNVIELYKDSDTVMAFIEEELTIDALTRTQREKLYEEYEKYCYKNDRGALSRNGFYKNLRTKGYAEITIQGKRFFKGLTFKETPFEPIENTIFGD